MTRSPSAVLLLLASAALAAAGCEEDPSSAPALGAANATLAGRSLAASIEDGAATIRGNDPAFAPQALAGTCHSVSGNGADLDGDQIPLDVTVTYTDCVTTDSFGTATLNGTQAVRDDDPGTAAFAFTIESHLSLAVVATNGATVTVGRDGVVQGSQPSGTYRTDVDATHSVDAQANGETFSSVEEILWSTNYAPASPWQPGQPAVAGTYSVEGDWTVDVEHNGNHGAAAATVETLAPLAFDPACETAITGGTVRATYEGPNATRSITVTWSACGEREATYQES